MKLAYLTNQYPKISHTFIRREIRALASEGIDVERFTLRRTAEALTDAEDHEEAERTRALLEHPAAAARAAAEAMVARPTRFAQASRCATQLAARSDTDAWRHAAYLTEACLLERWCRDAGIDHVHVHFGTNSATVAWLCHLLGGPPFSMTVHGPEEFDRARAIGLPEKLQACAFAAAVSHFGRSQLLRLLPPDAWSKVRVVRCGLDAGFLEHEPPPIPTSGRLVFVGRLSEQKGVEVLVEAAAQVHRMNPARSFEIVLVGDGERRAALEARMSELGVRHCMKVTGWADADGVRAALRDARALVAPSFAEGLPVVIMEALALGRPVISTYIAGIPELVRPGESGWLVPASAVEPLARALAEALDAPPETLAALGRAGREAVRARHDARTNARELWRAISETRPGTER